MKKYHGKDLSTNDFTEGYKNKIDRMIEGTRGYSNYEIAVQNGFTGTEAEWLESIKGDKGDKGETGEVSLEQLEKATKTTKTTLGEILTIGDACPVGSKLDISGNSEQETRNGYNLLNIPSKKTLKGMYSHKLDNIIPNGSKITVSWDSYVLGGEKTPRIRF